jgi:hypothetical protein
MGISPEEAQATAIFGDLLHTLIPAETLPNA